MATIKLDFAGGGLAPLQRARLPSGGPQIARVPIEAGMAQGRAISAVGQVLTEFAQAERRATDADAAFAGNAQIAERTFELQQEAARSDLRDQAAAGAWWGERSARIVDEVASGLNLDPVTMREWRRQADQFVQTRGFNVRAEATQRGQQARVAETTAALEGLGNQAAAARNTVERRAVLDLGEQRIQELVASGAINPAQGQTLRDRFQTSTSLGIVRRVMAAGDLGAAMALVNDTAATPGLDADRRASLVGQIRTMQDAAAARSEAAAARRERAVAVEVGQMNALLGAGIVPEDRVARVLDMARGTALEPQVRQAVADGRALAGFRLASNDEQVRQLAEVEARVRGGNATDVDLAQYSRLRAVRQAQITAYQRDGLGAAVAEGIVPPQPPIDWTDPATLNSRVEQAAGVSARRGYAISPFNAEDLAAGVEAFTRGSPEQKLGIVQAVAAIADPQVRAAAIQHFERARGDAGRLPPGTLARVSDMLRHGTVESTQAARRLISDLTADVSDRARQIGESAEMRSALVTVQASGVQGVRVRQAEVAGGGAYAALVSRDMDVIQRVAATRMASGESSPTRAAQTAAATFNAGLAVVDDAGLGHVYFPASAGTPAQVTAGLRLLRDRTAGEANTDPAQGRDGAVAGRARAESARRAVWINEGAAFTLVSRGEAGVPVPLRTATLEEVTQAATGEAARQAGERPVAPMVIPPPRPGGDRQPTPANTLPSLRGEAPTLR